MAGVKTNVPGSNYGNIYIDALIWGGTTWDPASGPIKVYWGQSENFAAANAVHGNSDILLSGNAAVDWTQAEKDLFVYAMSLYSSVCGLTFQVVDTVQDADIVWWKTKIKNDLLGLHETPADKQVWGYFNPETPSWANLHFGGDGLNTIIHELGHGLGLAHPHDGGSEDDASTFPGVDRSEDIGELGLNQGIWTIMSYNPGWHEAPYDQTYGEQGGLGALDIAALQKLYGVNPKFAEEDDLYELFNENGPGTGWVSLWDTGGDDTISGAKATGSVIIDLRAATLTPHAAGAGGYASYQVGISGGCTIAKGVVIENAVGGRSDDALIGNEAKNTLHGNDGADQIAGMGEADILRGGAGDDTLDGGAGADLLDGGADDDSASYAYAGAAVVVNLADPTKNKGEAEGDTYASIESVVGSNFADDLTGNGGTNLLSGGAGADTLAGGGGDDVYVLEDGTDRIVENAGDGNDTIITALSASLASFTHCETLIAAFGTAAINLSGSANGDRLIGNDGANVIDGQGGADAMDGGAGDDTYVMDDAGDQVSDTSGNDTAVVSFSYVLDASLENLTGAGARALVLVGNDHGNAIRGGAGADVISGLLGRDMLSGGAGKDTFLFNTRPSAANLDTILDFNVKDDTIALSKAIFKKIGKAGKLKKDFFAIGKQAKDKNDFIVYDKAKGTIAYDPDGKGGAKAVVFDVVKKGTALTFADFIVV